MASRERRLDARLRSGVPMTALSLVVAVSSLCAIDPAASRTSGLRSSQQSPPGQDQEPVWVATLRTWRSAVEDHQPGKVDRPLVGINGWSRQDLTGAITDLLSLRDLLVKAYAKRAQTPSGARLTVRYNSQTFGASDIERLIGVTPDEATRGDVNRLLKRAAVLHTDVALLLPADVTPIRTFNGQVARDVDGRVRGFEGTIHWEIARKLLDGVTPDRARDPFVRSWYQATTAVLMQRAALAYAEPHLEHAREALPDDPVLLFDSGCLHEAYAAPLVQAAVRSRSDTNVGSANANWQRAERFFRAALTADANMTEARIRLGRVVGLLGRHQEAIAELQRAVAGAQEPLLHYYVEMFLGAEEQALGHGAAARAHYDRAARLYPTAQSPHLALSEIGQRDGDRTRALGAIQQAFVVTADAEHRADPWWNYLSAPFANGEELLAKCRREIGTEKLQ